jgi:hypothetical protein
VSIEAKTIAVGSDSDIRRFLLNVRFAPQEQALTGLFDRLIGKGQRHRQHVEAKRLGRLEVDHQFELVWL